MQTAAQPAKRLPRTTKSDRPTRRVFLDCAAWIIPLHVVDDLLGGIIRVAWRNLRPYIESQRRQIGSQKNWERFQWMAEQVNETAPAEPISRSGPSTPKRLDA